MEKKTKKQDPEIIDVADDEIEIVSEANEAPEASNDDTQEKAEEAPNKNMMEVPDYRDPDLDEKSKATMDEFIEEMDPYNHRSVSRSGATLLDELDKVATQIVQDARDDGTLRDELKDIITDGTQDIEGLGELAGRLKNYAKQQATNLASNHKAELSGAAVGTMIAPGIGTALGAGGGALAKYFANPVKNFFRRDKEEILESREEIEDALRHATLTFNNYESSLKELAERIPEKIDMVNEFGKQRIESYKNISLLMGALNEIILRVSEKDYLEAEKAAKEKPGEISRARMNEVGEALARLKTRLRRVATQRFSFMGNTAQLKTLKNHFQALDEAVDNHLTHSLKQWNAVNADAALILWLSDTSKTMDDLNAHLDNVTLYGQDIQELITDTIINSQNGTQDPEKVIETLNRAAEQADKLSDFFENVDNNNEEMFQRLEESAINAVKAQANLDHVRNQRVLTAAKDTAHKALTQGDSAKKDDPDGIKSDVKLVMEFKGAQSADNDNKDDTPQTTKKAAPRKKKTQSPGAS